MSKLEIFKRTCGCGERGRHKATCKLKAISMVQKEDDEIFIDADIYHRPILAWSFNKSKQSTVEKRITKLINKKNAFYLTVTKPDDIIEEWFIDGGNWTTTKHLDGKYHGLIGHINNLLPFIKGERISIEKDVLAIKSPPRVKRK